MYEPSLFRFFEEEACSACEKVQGSSCHALPDMIVVLDLFAGLAFHLARFELPFFFMSFMENRRT